MDAQTLARLEAALAAGELPRLACALVAEGRSIRAAYNLIYSEFQTGLRRAGRSEEAARLVAAAAAVQEALGGTMDAALRARIDRHVREDSLRELVLLLHDHEGWSKQALYDALLAFTFVLRREGREAEEDRVGDDLDALSGHCARSSCLWPDEPPIA